MSRALDDFNRELAERNARARAEGLPCRGDANPIPHNYQGAFEREPDGILRSCFVCVGWAVGVQGRHLCQRIAHVIQPIEIHGACDFWKRDQKRMPHGNTIPTNNSNKGSTEAPFQIAAE